MPSVVIPSKPTAELWGSQIRHALRIELVVLLLSTVSLVTCVAQIVHALGAQRLDQIVHTAIPNSSLTYSHHVVLAREIIVLPVVNLFLSIADMYWYSIRSLNPVWTLVSSMIMLGGWIIFTYFAVVDHPFDNYSVEDKTGLNSEALFSAANSISIHVQTEILSISIIQILSAGVIALTYSSYLITSAIAINKVHGKSRSWVGRPRTSVGKEVSTSEQRDDAIHPHSNNEQIKPLPELDTLSRQNELEARYAPELSGRNVSELAASGPTPALTTRSLRQSAEATKRRRDGRRGNQVGEKARGKKKEYYAPS